MKWRGVSFVLALVLAVAGLAAAHRTVQNSGSAVGWSETTLRGDKSAAEGLTLTDRRLLSHLFWSSELGTGTAETEFAYKPEIPWTMPEPCRVLVQTQLTWLGDQEGLTGPEWDWTQGPASRTEPDSTHQERARYRDFSPVYHLEFRLELPGHDLGSNSREEDPERTRILTELSEAFHFPVLDDHMVEMTITRTEEDVTSEWYDYQNWPQIGAVSTGAGEQVYFVVYARDAEGEQMDYSLTPGGYALYRLDFGHEVLTMDDLRTVAPLDPAERLLELKADGDGSHVLLLTQNGRDTILRVFEAATGKLLTELTSPGTYANLQGVWSDNGLIFFCNGPDFHLLRGGQEVLSGQLPPELEQTTVVLTPALAFDGERMALGFHTWLAREGRRSRHNILLAVCDRTGLQYLGELNSTLDGEDADLWDDDGALQLCWNEKE